MTLQEASSTIRATLDDATRYRGAGPDREYDPRLDALQPVLERRVPAVIHADREAEIREAMSEPINAIVEAVTDDAEGQSRRELARTAGSIDNMAPGNRFLNTLVAQPVVPAVTSHSIIAVRGTPDLEDAGDRRKASDGVVKYESARLDDVASELVVPSGHSCLNHPWTIGELRRILLSHVGLKARGPAELNLP